MKVFNLTAEPLDFHGVTIPPRGGWREVPSLDTFASDRDLEMVKRGVISLQTLPPGWRLSEILKAPPKASAPAAAPVVEEVQEKVEAPRSGEKRNRERWGR